MYLILTHYSNFRLDAMSLVKTDVIGVLFSLPVSKNLKYYDRRKWDAEMYKSVYCFSYIHRRTKLLLREDWSWVQKMMAESKCYLNTTGQSGFKKFRAVTNAINDTETFRQVSSSEDAPLFFTSWKSLWNSVCIWQAWMQQVTGGLHDPIVAA